MSSKITMTSCGKHFDVYAELCPVCMAEKMDKQAETIRLLRTHGIRLANIVDDVVKNFTRGYKTEEVNGFRALLKQLDEEAK